MATPTINLELLVYFSPILLLILVFALLYGVLQFTKILGSNKALHAIIAFLAALFVTVFSEGAREMVTFIIPWFTMLSILIVFSIMLYKIFGATDADIRGVIKGRPEVYWTLFIIIVIIVLGALSQAFGQSQLPITSGETGDEPGDQETGIIDMGNPGTSDTTSGSFNQNLGATFYHPKIIGTLFLLIIGAIAVAFLARPVTRV